MNYLFSKDIYQATFLAYGEFESFKRPVGMNIIDFINKFERLYNNIKKYDMELSTGVGAFRLFKSEDKQQLARATLPSLTFIMVVKKGVDLVESKQIRTIMIVGIVLIME